MQPRNTYHTLASPDSLTIKMFVLVPYHFTFFSKYTEKGFIFLRKEFGACTAETYVKRQRAGKNRPAIFTTVMYGSFNSQFKPVFKVTWECYSLPIYGFSQYFSNK